MADVIQNKLFERKLTLKKKTSDKTDSTENFSYAVCLVNIKALGVRTFSYAIPEFMKSRIKIGQALLVPFGRQGAVNAFCVGFSNYMPEGIKAKNIIKIVEEKPLFTSEYLKLLEWVANYYCTDLITVLNAAIPLKLIEKTLKTELCVEYVRDFGATKRQLEVLEKLKFRGKMSLVDFEKFAKTTRATMKKLQALGCVNITEEEIYRNPLDILNIDKTENLYELSPLQNEVYQGIKEKIKNDNSSKILIHGVTASGKTEVYFKLIDDTVKSGKNVLFLAPEIALASQLTKRLAKKFGTKDVGIWHSSISEGERYDVWQKLYKNEIKILAGARSAVFAPLQNIGLIIIDEEHESAYKQTSPAPRYDARLVAEKLSELNNCPLILGSATPDISSYYEAKNSGNLFKMLKRYNNAKIAPVTVINMQQYGQAAYKRMISIPLQLAIKDALDKNQQVILLINRRGYSTYTQCQGCGHVIECPNCAIPMIWHAKDHVLKCHYCNHFEYFPDVCPNCGCDALKNSGTGTQKIEEYIEELFQGYKIARVDSDVMVKKGEHIRLLDSFQKGEIDILIGTHALFTEDVIFKDLAFVVVDEQHRFGVKQRLELSKKGNRPDIVVMTATPIPRTLVLTEYGDMSYSKIDELPKGRKPVDTRVMGLNKTSEVIEALKRKVSDGSRVYWICPLIEESEKSDLAAAEKRFEILSEIFPSQVGLIHGKMKEDQKDAVMESFKQGQISILVSTTVVEVGVNVPEATVMVIERAERFGLSQLHQLRGRIKRSSEASTCLLLYGFPLSQTAQERLNVMRQSEDGFVIAEKDLDLRGGGEILGVKQSGFTSFKLADLEFHKNLLLTAHQDAEMILNKDPNLESPRGQSLRILLYLFHQDQALETYKAG